ncbi:MAG: hypothetical protein WC390_08665 [Sulfurimonas sp.]|jgi:hypothetical protein
MPEIDSRLCTYYAFTDPASGKSKSGSSAASIKQSKQAITVIAVSPQTHIFSVYAWLGKLPTTGYIDKLLKVRQQYNPKIFGVEAVAMQSLFADVMRKEAKRQNQLGTFLGINIPTNIDKKFRIRTILEPVINYGRLFVAPNLFELDAAIRGFPAADEYLDLIDCFASCVKLVPRRAEVVIKNEELQQLAKYLRDSGSPPWYIERRIAEERQKLATQPANSNDN